MSENIKIGYKVVSKVTSKTFKPATPYALQSFRYKLGVVTEHYASESGPIAVFETEESAKRFFNKFGDLILKVEFEESAEKILWKKNPPSFSRYRSGSNRGYRAESNGITELDDFPSGTILAEWVKPIEIIEF